MARGFSSLNIRVPLRTTWEESWQLLQDEGGPPVDLTGYVPRMFLQEVDDCGEYVPGATPITYDGASSTELVITPLDGKIDLKVAATDVKALSDDNSTRIYAYDVELYVPAGAEAEYVVPLFKGRVVFQPRVHLL